MLRTTMHDSTQSETKQDMNKQIETEEGKSGTEAQVGTGGARVDVSTDDERQAEVLEVVSGEEALSAADGPAEAAEGTERPPESSRVEVPEGLAANETFEELGVPSDLLEGVAALGYARPTAVQAAIYQRAMENQDLIVRSKTGTGKTAAFMLPVLARIPAGEARTRALVLVPTRELAIQVAEEGAAIARFRKLTIVPIYGGVGLGQQAEKLRSGAEVVVGTPGRTLDHIRRGNLDLSNTAVVVLDEADEMLSMGFLEEVTSILRHVPVDHQTLLLSATVGSSVAGIISQFMRDPHEIFLSTDARTVDGIRNVLYECSEAYPKARSLLYVLYQEDPESAIIFCNTRDDCAFLAAYLQRQGFDAEFINSDLSQAERTRVMNRIKRGELSFLVATDIAARGIDISDLTHVINYSLPDDPDLYLHRVGRTGRIGKLGTAITLVSGRDLSAELALERRYHIPFERRTLPSADEATALWTEKHLGLLREAADRLAFETYLPMVRHMLRSLPEDERDRLLATALRSFFSRERAGMSNETQERRRSEGEERSRGPASSSGRSRKRPKRRDGRGRDEQKPERRESRGGRRSSRGGSGGGREESRGRSGSGRRETASAGRRAPAEASGAGSAPPTDVLDPLAAFAAANDIDLEAWIEPNEPASQEGTGAPKPSSGRKRRRRGRRKRRNPKSNTTTAPEGGAEGQAAGESATSGGMSPSSSSTGSESSSSGGSGGASSPDSGDQGGGGSEGRAGAGGSGEPRGD